MNLTSGQCLGALRLNRWGWIALVAAVTISCGPLKHPDTPDWDGQLCNGHSELCDRSYRDVTYLMAHNAMSSLEDGWLAANHRYNLQNQLGAGVRGFMLDIYDEDGEVMLCHASCEFGKRPLLDALIELHDFMMANPSEVLTIIFESNVSGSKVVDVFDEAGLEKFVLSQDVSDPWPTLRFMSENQRRLVVLTDEGGGNSDWYLPVWDFAWETEWSVKEAAAFTCDVTERGNPSNSLFIFNHFLTNPWANENLASHVNQGSFLVPRAKECATVHGKNVNFVTVDFYSSGETAESVDVLNGLIECSFEKCEPGQD